MTPKKFPRRKKLIRPHWQLKLTGAFLGMTVLAMLLQFLVLGQRLLGAVGDLDGPGGELADQIPGMLLQVLFLSVVAVVPVMTALGVLLTFRFAGPIHRFEQHLHALARGDDVGECRIREGDELQSLCDAVNAVTMRVQDTSAQLAAENDEPVRAA